MIVTFTHLTTQGNKKNSQRVDFELIIMTSSLFVAIKNLQTLYWICKFVQPPDFVILNHMYSTACVCVTKDTRLFKIKFSML